MKLRFSARRLQRRVRAVSARLLNRFYWRETAYYYFGEFGYFNVEVLGGLEALFQNCPDLRLKIATYASYAKLLESRFPDRVQCVSLEWHFAERRRDCHKYNCNRLQRALFWRGFNQKLESLFDDLVNRGQVHEARLFYLKAPLRAQETDPRRQFISIFPRGRKSFASKNLDPRQWDEILRTLAGLTSLTVVVHGVNEEMTAIPMADTFIRPKDVLEQVFYLNHSRFCVSPDSGFVQFALNCGCDVLVIGGTIQYHEFAKFNPFGKQLVITSQKPEEYLSALSAFAAACDAIPMQSAPLGKLQI